MIEIVHYSSFVSKDTTLCLNKNASLILYDVWSIFDQVNDATLHKYGPICVILIMQQVVCLQAIIKITEMDIL